MGKARVSQTGHLRSPIVAVLGHVDHGKTTLLDAIRKTKVVGKEAGGITQSIGASVVSTKEGKKITFIDTPGHAAFAKMRSRGAQVSDIVILVVAADDGVKPQTKESLKYIKAAKIPFIVAATKIDLPAAKTQTVRSQLEKEGVSFEGRGGDVPLVSVSGKTGEGIQDLLEMIILVAEVNEIRGNPEEKLVAVVIETTKDRRGPLVSVVVRNGTLKVSQSVVAEKVGARARGLFNDRNEPVKKTLPGEPALILGFSDLPPVGSLLKEQEGKGQAQKRPRQIERRQVVKEGQLPIVLKAKSSGVLEAILANLPDDVVVIASGVGDVNESDVFLAKSSGPTHVIAFDSKVSSNVSKLAETEGVLIETFDVIYELTEELEELLKKKEKKILGRAEIIASFPYNDKRVAGCRILQGRITKSDKLILMRGEKEIGSVRVVSIKKQKEDVSSAKEGEEFGIIFAPQLDFGKGDMLVSMGK